MIFSTEAVLSPNNPVFQGRVAENLAWQSAIFSPALDGIASWDTAITQAIGEKQEYVLGRWPDGTVITESVSFAARQGMFNMVNVTRQAMGQVATTVGYINRAIPLLKKINHPSATKVVGALNVVAGALDVVQDQMIALYEAAMDAIGILPVVGWIIKTCVKLGQFVVGIIDGIRQKRGDEAREFLARQAGIPISATEFSAVADTVQARLFFDKLGPLNDPQWVVTPRYGARPVRAYGRYDDWQAQWRGLKQWAGEGESSEARQLAWAWIVTTNEADGLGFVPGTRNLHGAMWFPTRYCGTVRDLGDLFPSARVGAYNWWNQVLESPTAMMSIDAVQAERAWMQYMEAAFQFALLEVRKGWTCNEATKPFSSQFLCVGGTSGVGSCQRGARGRLPNEGKWLSIPGDGHMSAHVAYLSQLFFGDVVPPRINQSRPAMTTDGDVSNIDWSQAVPVQALRELRSRQIATLQGYDAPYVDASERFRALHNDAELRQIWQQTILQIFDANEWRNIRFEDVPPGSDVRNALQQRCDALNIDCMNLGPSPHTRMGTPVLNPPDLPPPQAPVEVDTTPDLSGLVSAQGGRRRSGGGMGVALGLVAVAALLARKR